VIAHPKAAPSRANTRFAPTRCMRQCPNVMWSDLETKMSWAISDFSRMRGVAGTQRAPVLGDWLGQCTGRGDRVVRKRGGGKG
jgi:hypothetical protein